MLMGLVTIFASLPLLVFTLSEKIGRFLESFVVAGITSVMVLIWLIIWKELAFRYFSRMIKERE
jgi:TM2 domain-containing membrane protein YozV